MKRGKNGTRANNRNGVRAESRVDGKMDGGYGGENSMDIRHLEDKDGSKIESKRRERGEASDNEEAYLNVRFPQVTNTVK